MIFMEGFAQTFKTSCSGRGLPLNNHCFCTSTPHRVISGSLWHQGFHVFHPFYHGFIINLYKAHLNMYSLCDIGCKQFYGDVKKLITSAVQFLISSMLQLLYSKSKTFQYFWHLNTLHLARPLKGVFFLILGQITNKLPSIYLIKNWYPLISEYKTSADFMCFHAVFHIYWT